MKPNKTNHTHIDPLNKNKMWLSQELYEFIEAHPDEIIVESTGKPILVIKVVAKGGAE